MIGMYKKVVYFRDKYNKEVNENDILKAKLKIATEALEDLADNCDNCDNRTVRVYAKLTLKSMCDTGGGDS